MKREFFATLEEVLFCDDYTQKFVKFSDLYEDFCSDNVVFCHHHNVASLCSLFLPAPVLHPTRILRNKGTNSLSSMARILHSVAHIEYCAITLALDSAYRFRNLPHSYYYDWLVVAREEFEHFTSLNALLNEIGFSYGDFPVHTGLYEAMIHTCENLEYRMGVVHRGLEAKGLDANPFVLAKFASCSHPICGKVKEVFGTILRDEIGHVSRGDKWWKFAVSKRTKQSGDFLELCAQFREFNLAGKTLNVQARLQCGFSIEELQALGSFYEKRTSF